MFRKRSLIDKISAFIYDGIIGNSIDITDSLVQWYKLSTKKVIVIPTAIDMGRINSENKDISKFSEQYYTILYVGSIQPRKEVEILIESVGKIIKENNLKCELINIQII